MKTQGVIGFSQASRCRRMEGGGTAIRAALPALNVSGRVGGSFEHATHPTIVGFTRPGARSSSNHPFMNLIHSLITASALLASTRFALAEQVELTVGTRHLSEVPFLGFGLQWSAYEWFDLTPEDWTRIERRLDFMKPAFVRCMLRHYWYCQGLDEGGKPVYDWNSMRMRKLYQVLDYCESRGIKVIIGDWDDPANNQDRQDPEADKLQPYRIHEDDPRLAPIIGDFLDHLTKTRKYTCLTFYNLLNEPNSPSSGCADFAKWKTAISLLHAEFRKRGYDRTIRICGPDVTFQKDFYWVDLTAQQLPDKIGAYEYHEYASVEDVETGFTEKLFHTKRMYVNKFVKDGRKIPFFMGEIGMRGGMGGNVKPHPAKGGADSQLNIYDFIYGVWMADFNAQIVRAGMDGCIAWNVDDAMHIQKDPNSGWPKLDRLQLKKWGFWNSMAEEIGFPEDANLRPWYYTWSLMSLGFPAGCHFVEIPDARRPGLRAIAARIGDGDWSFAVVNDSDQSCEVILKAPEIKKALNLRRFHYFENDRPADTEGFPKVKSVDKNVDLAAGSTVSMPSRGVVILTTLPVVE